MYGVFISRCVVCDVSAAVIMRCGARASRKYARAADCEARFFEDVVSYRDVELQREEFAPPVRVSNDGHDDDELRRILDANKHNGS